MIFCSQMASKALITPEQYLAASWEREPEYVHGEIVEKPLPNKKHGHLQSLIGALLMPAGYVGSEIRVGLAHDVFRLPDVAVWKREPEGELPTEPPFVAVEISSPDSRAGAVLQKLEQYRVWGAQNIWFVESQLAKLYVFDGGLKEVPQFELPEFNITITAERLFG